MRNITSHHGDRTKYINHILAIATICVSSYMRCADDAYPTLNRAALHKKIAKYEHLSQEEKNGTLVTTVRKSCPDCLYHKYRKKVAALAHAGADIPAVQLKTTCQLNTLLPDIVLMKDSELARLLINNKASIHEQTFDRDTAIHKAMTIELAEPLLAKHALEYLDIWQTQELINRLAWPRYSPDLIPLYRQLGFNVMACGDVGYTLLMNLILRPIQEPGIIRKAKLLLEELTIAQVKEYLAIQNHHNQTVFDLINQRASQSSLYRKYLYELRDFLQERTDPEKYPDNPQAVAPKGEKQSAVAVPECSVCLQPLKEQECITTKCNHIFHSDCLSMWVNQNHNCPLCRALV